MEYSTSPHDCRLKANVHAHSSDIMIHVATEQHLCVCRDELARLKDFEVHADHAAYERVLRAAHGRKTGFWQKLDRLNRS